MNEKPQKEREVIARRILSMGLDVLAVQEVEDIDTLRRFVREELNGAFRFVTLSDGNDPRLIDVAMLSKLPVGGVSSWQHAVHPARPSAYSGLTRAPVPG